MVYNTSNRMKQPTALSEKKLTLKQRKWLDLYIKTGNATEAARQAYDCTEQSARVIGCENLAKLNVEEFMESMGLTDHKLFTKLADGLDAFKMSHSFTEADTPLPDYAVRHKYLETALKLKKRLGPEIQQQTNIQMNVEFQPNE